MYSKLGQESICFRQRIFRAVHDTVGRMRLGFKAAKLRWSRAWSGHEPSLGEGTGHARAGLGNNPELDACPVDARCSQYARSDNVGEGECGS